MYLSKNCIFKRSMWHFHSTAYLEAMNGPCATGYLLGHGNTIVAVCAFSKVGLLQEVWPEEQIVGVFYRDMLDETKTSQNYLLFNTASGQCHIQQVEQSYDIISTPCEQAAINTCDNTDSIKRIEDAKALFNTEVTPHNANALKSLIKPPSDAKLAEYNSQLEQLVTLGVNANLLLTSQYMVDTLLSERHELKRRRNK